MPQPQVRDVDNQNLPVYRTEKYPAFVRSQAITSISESKFDEFALGKRTHTQSLLHKGKELTHRRIVKRVRKADKLPKDPLECDLESFLNEVDEMEGPPSLSRRAAIAPVGLSRASALPQLNRANAVIMMNQRNEALYI